MDKEDKIAQLEARIAAIEKHVIDASRNAAEAVWAQVFHDTIRDSTWLKNKTFSPGRWAVGYAYLYVMYRILNEMRPKCILDLGLGQTTRMIAQYAAHCKGVRHVVVESDPEWGKFFRRRFRLPKSTSLYYRPYEMQEFRGNQVRAYSQFSQLLKHQTFDLVSIDAPCTSEMRCFARIDMLANLATCLRWDFVIMIDDLQFPAVANTANAIGEELSARGIDFLRGVYSGAKTFEVFASPRFKWFTTL